MEVPWGGGAASGQPPETCTRGWPEGMENTDGGVGLVSGGCVRLC